MSEPDRKVVIIGGGPAGLTAAYELSKQRVPSTVLEKDEVVGGLARTVRYKGFLFDIGGHRFFTKVKAVDDMWREVLGDDLLRRSRLSRIYYRKRFFYYPFRLTNALFGLGLWNSLLISLSYVRAQLSRRGNEETFEQWVTNRFGKRLYRIFFKSYTEKVWGIPCSEISAEWAAQRIKGLSLFSALKNALLKQDAKDKRAVIKTLTDQFDYPRRGPGMMWERIADIIQRNGGRVQLGAAVTRICWSPGKVEAVEVTSNAGSTRVDGTHFISSMPVRELIQKLSPAAHQDVTRAADALNYRDFITVALVVENSDVFRDNWIYIHDPDVKVGRIQNFKNWSPDMVSDLRMTCLGLEYFCFEGDGLWAMSDEKLVELGKKELEILGLVRASEVKDGTVVRMQKAYPVYDSTYRESLHTIRRFLDGIANLQLVGRNGMHKYNNQDHAMLTAMLAAKNILGASYDLWKVNVDQEYHEEVTKSEQASLGEFERLASTQPQVPERLSRKPNQGSS